MKKASEIPGTVYDTTHEFIFDIFDFLEQEGNIKIDTIINNVEKSATITINGFINETGYKKNLVVSKTNMINELKNYLESYSKQEQIEVLKKLKLKLIKIREKILVKGQCNDEKNKVIEINRFVHIKDPHGFFSNYKNYTKYTKVWEKVFDESYKEIDDLISDIKTVAQIGDNKSEDKNNNKIKLNISVDKLACLLKILYNEQILELEDGQKTSFFKFITDNFQTTQQDNISVKSFKNKFDTPDVTEQSYWKNVFKVYQIQ